MVLGSNDTARRRPLCKQGPLEQCSIAARRVRRCYLHFANQMKGRRNCDGCYSIWRFTLLETDEEKFWGKSWVSEICRLRTDISRLGHSTVTVLHIIVPGTVADGASANSDRLDKYGENEGSFLLVCTLASFIPHSVS